MFKFLCSKKGFTVVELAVALIVIAILTAIAVPVFGNMLKKQTQDDCRNQRLAIETTIQQAMAGMVDNGKKQDKIYFDKLEIEKYCLYPGDGVVPSADDDYVGKKCFVLWYNEISSNEQDVVTLGSLRGGYRNLSLYPDYRDGCDERKGTTNYLKKQALADRELYKELANEEIPVCPFVEDEFDRATGPQYLYYVFDDGTVLCSCPECNEIK